MIFFVNYTLTTAFKGRIPIQASSVDEAEELLKNFTDSYLRSSSESSENKLAVRSEPPIDPFQLSLFEDLT